jgi:D-3-phosphoglycerate dehydrogenase
MLPGEIELDSSESSSHMNEQYPSVLALGHRFRSLDIEKQVLANLAEIIDGNSLTQEDLERILPTVYAVLLGTRAKLDRSTISKLSSCRLIVRYGVGVDNIDVEAATANRIQVVNIRDYCVQEVSDHTIALLLAANRRLIQAHLLSRNGKWGQGVMKGTARLSTQTLGVVGFGRIGQEVARKAAPLVNRILIYDPYIEDTIVTERNFLHVDFHSLVEQSDIITINCPLTKDTFHLFNNEIFNLMKPDTWIINTSRGEVINEDDLFQALVTGRLGGAALDVLSKEPPDPNLPLLKLDNVIITPHLAYYSEHAIRDLQTLAAEQVRLALQGQPLMWKVNSVE